MKRIFPWRTLCLLLSVVAVILVTFFLWEEDIDAWLRNAIAHTEGNRLWIGAILYLVLSSDIFLPIPSCMASTLCGMLLGPGWGFLVSFLAMDTTCLIGYGIGRGSAPLARKCLGEGETELLTEIHRKGGGWLVLGLRPVPILAEASLIFAGLAKMPAGRAALFAAVGNAAVSAIYAFIGAFFRTQEEHTGLAFAVCALLSVLFWLTAKFLAPARK